MVKQNNKGEKLVNITLTNKNTLSQDHHVSININTGRCSFTDKREISLKKLLNSSDFSHPLLTEPFTQTPDHVFHYEYDDIDGLLYSGIYVYSRLLHADKPLACTFKINPSPLFQHSTCAEPIYFSINSRKAAQESIQIKQLEAITSHLLGLKYQFSEHIIIDDQFTTEDLPCSVDGDSLYKSNDRLVALLKNPKDFSRYELRLISPEVGFGVFSKETIKKGDVISFYTGVKSQKNLTTLRYSFRPAEDCLNMYLDASQYGNITRYINHAPNDNNDVISSQSNLIEANIKSDIDYINGIAVVIYIATKNILKGDQLLVNYGEDYFKHAPMIRFKTNGRLLNTKKKFIWSSSQKKINYIKIMADYGVRNAQIHLLVRMAIIVSILIGVFYIL